MERRKEVDDLWEQATPLEKVVERRRAKPPPPHNHLTRDIREPGECPRCDCGWVSPPCPGPDEAAGFYGDHRAESEGGSDGRRRHA